MIKTIYTGPVSSGKTENLIKAYNLNSLNKIYYQISYKKDGVYDITSKSDKYHCKGYLIHPNKLSEHILDTFDDIFIDEVQFLNIPTIIALAESPVRIWCAGLDKTHLRRPFLSTMYLLGYADDVEKLVAKCEKCGGIARYSKCLKEGQGEILEEQDQFIPVCWIH